LQVLRSNDWNLRQSDTGQRQCCRNPGDLPDHLYLTTPHGFVLTHSTLFSLCRRSARNHCHAQRPLCLYDPFSTFVLKEHQTATSNGIASAAQDSAHQMPPCPSRADSKPNTDEAAIAVGQRHIR
jgi:hypothetical protein